MTFWYSPWKIPFLWILQSYIFRKWPLKTEKSHADFEFWTHKKMGKLGEIFDLHKDCALLQKKYPENVKWKICKCVDSQFCCLMWVNKSTTSMLTAINPLHDRSSSPNCEYSYKYVRRELGGICQDIIDKLGGRMNKIKITTRELRSSSRMKWLGSYVNMLQILGLVDADIYTHL